MTNEDYMFDEVGLEEIPPYLRKPPMTSKVWAESVVSGIDRRIAWLAQRGLRPHPEVLERRQLWADRLVEFNRVQA